MNITKDLLTLLSGIDATTLNEQQRQAYSNLKTLLIREEEKRANPRNWVFYE